MNALQAEEVLDLELISSLTPMCEDTHEWYDDSGELMPPPCGVTAVAQLIITCHVIGSERRMTLICAPLRDWLSDTAECSEHGLHDHTKILDL